MDNIYKDLKPSLNEIENSNNQNVTTTTTPQNKPLTTFTKSEFKLSPLAPAFVPRYAIPQPVITQQQQSIQNYYDNPEYKQNFPGLGNNGYESQINNTQHHQQEQIDTQQLNDNNIINNNQEQSNEFLREDDYYALNGLNDFIDKISKNPALYETNVQSETDLLNDWIIEDPDIIMECVVNNIMDQAIMDNNFRYNGVRFCLHLIENLHVTSSKGSFKQVLLQRCKREHSRRDTLSSASDNGLYLRGLTFFIADLSTKLNEPELILSVPDLLKTLLQNKSSDNIKSCCQILKLCGKNLTESLNKEGSIQILDSLFDELKSLANKSETENSVKNLINNVVELYNNNWVTPQSSTPLFNPYAKGNFNQNLMNNNFDQDDFENFNQVYDDTEYAGYDFGPCGDENNEDVCDAFEEFLKASGQM